MSAVIFNPRFALKDLPRDIRESVPPLTKRETLQALIFFLPFMALVVGIPFLSALGLEAEGAADVSFGALFVHILGVLFVFFVVDLVVLDWLIYCTITPKRLVQGLPTPSAGTRARGCLAGDRGPGPRGDRPNDSLTARSSIPGSVPDQADSAT
jgi:hypothetical protein